MTYDFDKYVNTQNIEIYTRISIYRRKPGKTNYTAQLRWYGNNLF